MAQEKKEENSTKSTISEVDAAMGRYYKSLNKKYNAIFATYCDDNGVDEETLQDEMLRDENEMLLIDFDDDFPFPETCKNKNDKFIASIILACYNDPKIEFNDGVPK